MAQDRESREHYVWVVDETGAEVPGSRRPASAFADHAHYRVSIDRLRGIIGEGCTITDDVDNWAAYWRERKAAGR